MSDLLDSFCFTAIWVKPLKVLGGTSALVDQRVLEPFVVPHDRRSLGKRKLKFQTISLPKEKLPRLVIKGDLPIEVHLMSHLKVPLEKMLEFLTMMCSWIINLKM